MSLDPNYLEYPHRHQGMDHKLYPYSNLFQRPQVQWPSAKSVAIWPVISLEWFPMVPSDTPFRAPGHMQTAYPDYRHYTARDYGNRVGAWRFLDALAKAGAKASFATNAAVAERYPELVRAVLDGGHELIAHSTDMNGTIDSSLAEAAERALIEDAMQRIEAASGVRPTGWLSIARSQSFHTLDLLKEAQAAFAPVAAKACCPAACSGAAAPSARVTVMAMASGVLMCTVEPHTCEEWVCKVCPQRCTAVTPFSTFIASGVGFAAPIRQNGGLSTAPIPDHEDRRSAPPAGAAQDRPDAQRCAQHQGFPRTGQRAGHAAGL